MRRQIFVELNKAETLPPKDGEWYSAHIRRAGGTYPVALQFYLPLQRWFDGRGRAVAEKDIVSWTRYWTEAKANVPA